MTSRRTFLKQSLIAAALPLVGSWRAPASSLCVCGHDASQHDAAGWCFVESGDGYADDCTKFYDVHSHDMDMPTGYVATDPVGLPGIYPEAWYPQGEIAAPCPPPDPGWRALLGGADYTDGLHYSPIYHIPYYPRGFDGDVGKKKVVKKTPNYLRSVGVPEDAVQAFQSYSLQFATYVDHDAHGVIGHKIDAAWAAVLQAYRACGPGTWQYNAVQNIGPISVVIEERPFVVCSSADVNVNVWAVGTVGSDYAIRVCVGHITNYIADPIHATWIRDIDSLLRWEFALAVAKRAGYVICTTQDEVNLQAPCGLAMKTHC